MSGVEEEIGSGTMHEVALSEIPWDIIQLTYGFRNVELVDADGDEEEGATVSASSTTSTGAAAPEAAEDNNNAETETTLSTVFFENDSEDDEGVQPPKRAKISEKDKGTRGDEEVKMEAVKKAVEGVTTNHAAADKK